MEFKFASRLDWTEGELTSPALKITTEGTKEALFDFIREGDSNLFLINLNLALAGWLSAGFLLTWLMDNLKKSIALPDYTWYFLEAVENLISVLEKLLISRLPLLHRAATLLMSNCTVSTSFLASFSDNKTSRQSILNIYWRVAEKQSRSSDTAMHVTKNHAEVFSWYRIKHTVFMYSSVLART